ncbi:hypothetical protein BDP55DRAFT_627534 [Colletotrichum godetiae]|uniref:Secreted protein n=1 Tax=Colletotrichum godetiae TaxID=1209918 RepID=A0AAJ0AWE9_9PEZI|nr:uncharacterized protein BDP55DRAFT_627534 [Colletotrichum godetiae]KAK1690842.1 hypothetical protein BDP55DRAFT_627534 [Colletotrichum godetiae]
MPVCLCLPACLPACLSCIRSQPISQPIALPHSAKGGAIYDRKEKHTDVKHFVPVHSGFQEQEKCKNSGPQDVRDNISMIRYFLIPRFPILTPVCKRLLYTDTVLET